MSIKVEDIVEFAAREGNKMIESQVNMKAKLFAALDKTPMKGRRAVINIVNGGLSSTSQVEDFGALPTESASVPDQGFADAVGYVSRLGLGRIALATLAGVDDSADLLDLQLQIAADDMARQIGRAVFGSQLGSPATTGSVAQAGAGLTATVVFSVNGGLADFREGEAYQVEPVAGTTDWHALCTSVVVTGNDAVRVTLVVGPAGVPGFQAAGYADAFVTAVGGVGANTFLTTNKIFLRGSRKPGSPVDGVVTGGVAAANAGLVTLQLITSATEALHGLPAGLRGWTGMTFGLSPDPAVGSPTPEMFMQKSKLLQARAGVAPTHLVLGGMASVAFAAAQISNGTSFAGGIVSQARRNVDGKLDKYGRDGDMESGLAMFGRPVLIDDNCPTTEAYLINKDHLKVGEWKKLSAEDEGGSPLLLSRSTFSKEVQFSCIYNLIARKRNAHARLIGLSI
jgi:hypothetical protein